MRDVPDRRAVGRGQRPACPQGHGHAVGPVVAQREVDRGAGAGRRHAGAQDGPATAGLTRDGQDAGDGGGSGWDPTPAGHLEDPRDHRLERPHEAVPNARVEEAGGVQRDVGRWDGRRGGQPGDDGGSGIEGPDDRAVVAGARLLGVHDRSGARVPHGAEPDLVAVEAGLGAPVGVQGLVDGEEPLEVADGRRVAIGDDGPGTRRQEAGAKVVDPHAGVVPRRLRVARLGVARGIAQVVEHDDRVRRQAERGDKRLAVVGVVRVASARDLVEAEAVTGIVGGLPGVRGGPAVAMPVVDHDRGAIHGGLHGLPGRVRAVDLHDVGGVLDRLGVLGISVRAIGGGGPLDRTHDDGDLDAAHRPRGSRSSRGRPGAERHRDKQGGGDRPELAQRVLPGVCRRSVARRCTLDSERHRSRRAPSRDGPAGREQMVPPVSGRRDDARQPRRRATRSASVGLERSRSDRIGCPSGAPATAGQGTPTAGSSQAKPSSSVPSYSLVTR